MSEIIIRNIKLPYKTPSSEAVGRAISAVKKIGCRVSFAEVCKRSVDAREKNNILFVYSVYLRLENKPDEGKLAAIDGQLLTDDKVEVEIGNIKTDKPPVVVGFGPAGMFAGLRLAENGYKPVIIERGKGVAERKADVDLFFTKRILNGNSNVQFGAGGAGTFSDGKLVTRINDPLCKSVLCDLVRFGAPEEILWQAKPHIGTDLLMRVVDNIEKYITKKGGRVLYNTRMTGIKKTGDGGVVYTTEGEIDASAVILAIGHSSRDTHTYLINNNYTVLPKDFSCGVRIEHLCRDIDTAMYGGGDISILGHGEYTLSHREGSRGVYTFCMCPGGEVVASSSEEGGVVVNGMSNYKRDGMNSNCAVAVSVLKEDFGHDPMKAIEFQRNLERNAFRMGGGDYSVPCQTVGDFLSGRKGSVPTLVKPTYMNGNAWRTADLREGLPSFISDMLSVGIRKFNNRIKGFSADHAILSGYETRTSSPVRILRNELMVSPDNDILYPSGEGAGYAGGITSAAVDGIRSALAVMKRFSPDKI